MAPIDRRGRPSLSLVGQSAGERFYAHQVAQRVGPVLLLGCGNGRLAWELSRSGATVMAVDPSPLMIHSAEERRSLESAEASARLRLTTADLRALRIPERFATVLAPQNAIGLMVSLDDVELLLATVRAHLEPQGALLFDVLNFYSRGEHEGGSSKSPPVAVVPGRPVFTPHLRERDRSSGPTQHAGLRRLRLRQFSTAELDLALARAGFVALERYGSFEGKPFDAADPLQIVVAGST